MGNSNYNSFQFTLKRTKGALTVLACYSFSKSLDWSSNLQEQVNPFNFRQDYALSAFDITHNVVISFIYVVPYEKLFHTSNRVAQAWSWSGSYAHVPAH